MKLRLTYLYRSSNDSLSGPGYSWEERSEIGDEAEVRARIQDLVKDNACSRTVWEHENPEWRIRSRMPSFKCFKIQKLETWSGSDALLAETETFFKDELGRQEANYQARMEKYQEEKEIRDLALLAELTAKYAAK